MNRFAACYVTLSLLIAMSASAGSAPLSKLQARAAHFAAPHAEFSRPWTEGISPTLENQVFDATYHVLPSHNILKVYVFDAPSYGAAGIRFSARVPHQLQDLSLDEMEHEAALIIRTTFDQFPSLRSIDVWATIPVALARQKAIENTVFSVSAERSVYDAVRNQGLSDAAFLGAFGQVWAAAEVRR
jgi:hypothetical protein